MFGMHFSQSKNARLLNFSYSCMWPKKLIVSKADLAAQVDANVNMTKTTKCKATGEYDIDITGFACTKPCPLPRISSPSIMVHNWTNTTDNAEFMDVIRCLKTSIVSRY